MPKEVHLWRIDSGDQLNEVALGRLDLEERLENWLARDISVLDPDLLVIGRQVLTMGGPLDLLCIDEQGDLVIVELKCGKTPREITAQVLDYASTVVSLTNEQIRAIAEEYLKAGFDEVFAQRFHTDIPEALNTAHRMLVVGSDIDAASERIIRYLSDTHGVDINAATFQYFKLEEGNELLSRVFFIEPSEVDQNVRSRGASKHRRNLTVGELEELAEQSGVAELYGYAVSTFGPLGFRTGTTLSSVKFEAQFAGSRKVVLSLIPGDSTSGQGLHFQLYSNRYAELVKMPPEEVEALMPRDHTHWEYVGDSGPDWQGFEGFLRTDEDVDRIAGPLRSSGNAQ